MDYLAINKKPRKSVIIYNDNDLDNEGQNNKH